MNSPGDTLAAEELSVGRMTGGAVGGVGPGRGVGGLDGGRSEGWVGGTGGAVGGSDTTSVREREGPALFSSHCRVARILFRIRTIPHRIPYDYPLLIKTRIFLLLKFISAI